MSLVLRNMAEQGEGSLQVVIDETGHLPKEKDFSSAVDTVRRAFRSGGLNEQTIAPQTRKLMTMSRNLLRDRDKLRSVVKGARGVLSEWSAWLETGEEEEVTEEKLRERLECVAEAMSRLGDALEEYESEVLKKLKN
jgi:hypothetical protein